MFALSSSQRYYYYIGSTDMRKSFNGLSGLVNDHKNQVDMDDLVYIFVNRRKDKVKLLQWKSNGFMLYYKRLEEGTFKFPKYDIASSVVKLNYTEMIMLIDGISILNLKKNKRYSNNNN
jgi:transposase